MSRRLSFDHNEPRWMRLSSQNRLVLPKEVAAWLKESGSLTKAVLMACDGRFNLQLRGQRWGRGYASERDLLGMRQGSHGLIREVELRCDENAWVFARTLIPATSFRGRAKRLARLRTKPLGAVLFADRSTQRVLSEVARITPRHALYHVATEKLLDKPAEIWGRRAIYRYAKQPILVNEIFLPAIPER